MREKALIIGGGGREHALAEYMGRSPHVDEIFCAPGNGGTEAIANNVDLSVRDIEGLAKFCLDQNIGFVVVGPENSLEAGVVDRLEREKLRVFGPNRAAARLETSKIFAHKFMERHDIPHPRGWESRDFHHALGIIDSRGPSEIVVKGDGIAGGKAVALPESHEEAETVLGQMMVDKKFGAAGESVLIQERIHGRELSVLAICHENKYEILPLCQDYKRRDENDKGPNTGGMGSVAPADILTVEKIKEVQQTIIEPTLQGMAEEGNPYKGMLYAGIMLTDEGPKVIEYNTRFGDPECQVLLPLISEDIYPLLKEAATGNVVKPSIKSIANALIVLAAGNYPDGKADGEIIHGLDVQRQNIEVFHAGTLYDGDKRRAVGGRVLNVAGLGGTIDEALKTAYSAIGPDAIHFNNMHYRPDIGSNL